ncbi:putative ATP-grasp-modified RiPP [Streptomyces niveus]|uniref:putative ATP-grasp-modified RiPP n=1 Tax=Streptomyces niveus TaxID=193462 RepID=UPI00341FA790
MGHAANGVVRGHHHGPAVQARDCPDTQIALIEDERGRAVELGSHGTSTSGLTPTTTTPGDGSGPGGATDADSTESYDQDRSSG